MLYSRCSLVLCSSSASSAATAVAAAAAAAVLLLLLRVLLLSSYSPFCFLPRNNTRKEKKEVRVEYAKVADAVIPSAFRGSGGFENVAGRVGSGQEVFKFHGSGLVKRFSNLTGRVGAIHEVFKMSRVGSGHDP